MTHPFQSARLTYRAVEPEGDSALFLSIFHDPFGFHNANISLPKPQNKASAQAYLKQVAESKLVGVVMCLSAENSQETSSHDDSTEGQSKENNLSRLTPIGAIHLSALEPKHAHHRHTEIGIDILPRYQNQGYGSEAIRWITDFAFSQCGMHRVLLRSLEWSPGARRLYERLGFQFEGREREAFWSGGRWWDGFSFGMLEGEWRVLQEAGNDAGSGKV
ncbi:hypothetical protein LTR62_004048 [Meristemomyces frigidus]|uniref:N-acetyltransferase domain-containing protein n=1 Tax=Meristemomyces frigidus TaxID=1508187 RepID=A0AAN7TQ38_9PEZI|nr:hypothetical protein LTR62_004048 [Meristemomyces frigidus]